MKDHTFANGDRMPMLGLGTWKSEPGKVYAAVREAIRIGYRHIDCAPIYGNEAEIGSALRDAIQDGDVRREALWITSKVWGNAHGRENVRGALEKTLSDLGLEYLDLFLMHWPIPLKPGVVIPASAGDFATLSEIPIRSTWEGMEQQVHAGLSRHIGVSNFSVKKLGELVGAATLKVEVNQVEMHPLLQQNELLEYCSANGIHVTAYSPLGSSDRPEFFKAADEPVLLDNPVIKAVSERHGCTPAQVLLAWHLHRGVSVIPKSVSPARLRENLAAADLALGPADFNEIAGLDRHYRLVNGAFWIQPGGPWTMQSLWDEA